MALSEYSQMTVLILAERLAEDMTTLVYGPVTEENEDFRTYYKEGLKQKYKSYQINQLTVLIDTLKRTKDYESE